jgi:hypothetical protein
LGRCQEPTPSLSGIGDEIVQPQVLLVQARIAAATALLLTLSYPEDARMLFAYSRATALYLLVPIAVVFTSPASGRPPTSSSRWGGRQWQ